MADNNITKLVSSLIGPGQSIEDALQQLFSQRSVTTAIGEQLNVLGRLVGQPRNGMSDTDFRRLIRARISVNRSKGTITDVLVVAELVLDEAGAYLHIDNQGNAALVLRIEDIITDWAVADLVIKMLRDTVAAGVRIILEFWLTAEPDLFHFDTFVPGGSVGKGWGSTLNPAVGGRLASALD